MHYIIDGYNLMFRVAKACDDLQAQRESIIHNINTKVQFLGLEATLVFDAQYQIGDLQRSHYKNLEILYTAERETADEYILHAIKEHSTPYKLIVVTSDKHLAASSRRLGAKTENVEEFQAQLNKRFANKLRRSQEEAKKPLRKDHPPAKAVSPPPLMQLGATPEECFNIYLKLFEERFSELAAKAPPPAPTPVKFKSKKKKFKPRTEPPEPGVSDIERWLKLFEQKTDSLE